MKIRTAPTYGQCLKGFPCGRRQKLWPHVIRRYPQDPEQRLLMFHKAPTQASLSSMVSIGSGFSMVSKSTIDHRYSKSIVKLSDSSTRAKQSPSRLAQLLFQQRHNKTMKHVRKVRPKSFEIVPPNRSSALQQFFLFSFFFDAFKMEIECCLS